MSATSPMPLAPLVRRAVQSRRRRARTVVLGVATSTLLILVLLATYRTVSLGIVSYAGQEPIDLWVAPTGTDNLVRSSAILPHNVVDVLLLIEGIQTAAPIIRSFVNAESVDGLRRSTLLALGYPGPDGLGGPPEIHSGHAPRQLTDIAIDRAAAYRLEVGIGDELKINGMPMKVVGITRRTNLMATQFAFMDTTHAELSSGFKDRVSFVAVALHEDADEFTVIREIERHPGLSVFRRTEWVANNLQEVAAGFRPMVLLITAVGLIAAAVLVALLVQSVVDDRRSEIAVLLAMGVPLSNVSFAILAHVAKLVGTGSVLGGICSFILSTSLERWAPSVEMQTAYSDIIGIVVLLSAVGVLAAILPTARLRLIDPVEAFRP
jgi:MacB-like periplasmic core domain/FtsX-like permease family